MGDLTFDLGFKYLVEACKKNFNNEKAKEEAISLLFSVRHNITSDEIYSLMETIKSNDDRINLAAVKGICSKYL